MHFKTKKTSRVSRLKKKNININFNEREGKNEKSEKRKPQVTKNISLLIIALQTLLASKANPSLGVYKITEKIYGLGEPRPNLKY
jgi:hypothetical protein